MTAIFISHSSADNEAAMHMMAWLEKHPRFKLHFTPTSGGVIPPESKGLHK